MPPKILSNKDLEKIVDTSEDWIRTRTGIDERHIAEAGVATSDLATNAALEVARQDRRGGGGHRRHHRLYSHA